MIRGLPRGICYPRERKSRDSRGFARAARLGSPIMSISNTTNCTQAEPRVVVRFDGVSLRGLFPSPPPRARAHTLPATRRPRRRRRRLHRSIKFSGE